MILLTFTAFGALPVGVAAAAATCTFDAASATATVEAEASVETTISRSGNAIQVDGSDCAASTVTTTDTVIVNANSATDIAIDLAGGAFAPGKTSEGADSEIEFSITFPSSGHHVRVLGSATADAITLGRTGSGESINLNADEATVDFDVDIDGIFQGLEVFGYDGDDVLSAYGEGGFPSDFPDWLHGGPGDDQLLGNISSTAQLNGNSGTDTIRFDRQGFDGVTVDLVAGTADGSLVDYTLSGIENVAGSPGFDTIIGDDHPNVLTGGWAPDTFVPGGGDDTIDGGVEFQDIVDYSGDPGPINMDFDAESASAEGTDSLQGIEKVIGTPYDDWFLMGQGSSSSWHSANGEGGTDTISFANSQTAIWVDLPSGTAKRSGGPTDQLSGIEAVIGSPFGDDVLGTEGPERFAAGAGRDKLRGSGDNDVLNGGAGGDTLQGQAGDDALRGGLGRDDLDGGFGRDACAGGPGRDNIVGCERNA